MSSADRNAKPNLPPLSPVVDASEVLEPKRVLLADPNESWTGRFTRAFEELGWEVAVVNEWRELLPVIETFAPVLAAIDLRLGPAWNSVLKAIPQIKRSDENLRVVVVTSFDSVASAVQAVRSGADGFLAKPATPEDVIAAAMGLLKYESQDHVTRSLSLDRAIWEYINGVLIAAGSLAEAARMLQIDRRSLRRMLSKYAPR